MEIPRSDAVDEVDKHETEAEPELELEPSLSPSRHRSVMPREVLEALNPREGSVILDGTAGAGGHLAELARMVGASGLAIGLDRDPEMLELAEANTRGLSVRLVRASYSEARRVLADLKIDRIDGALLDLGLSSDQLAWRHRGFSFATDGPLDMRFDPSSPRTAADLVNRLRPEELADIFYQYGEERWSRRIAKRIEEARRVRRIETTGELADLIRRATPRPGYSKGRGKGKTQKRSRASIDPSTRVFQALRIAVNQELDHLEEALALLPDLLNPGGRLAILSFHSLEDRMVKNAFRQDGRLRPLTKKPIPPTDEETESNPRARSAKLRVAERCGT